MVCLKNVSVFGGINDVLLFLGVGLAVGLQGDSICTGDFSV